MTENEPGYRAPDLALLGEDHIRAYQETGGETGYLWNGAPTLLVYSTGRKTAQPRTTALIFAQDGDDYLIVASMGGAPQHPQWYLNVTANPDVEIQVRDQRIPVTARTAESPDERSRLWKVLTAVWPNYDTYQARTDREIPVVVLTPR